MAAERSAAGVRAVAGERPSGETPIRTPDRSMRLLILGATGKTGGALVAQALARGHSVTAFARSPLTAAPHTSLRAVTGNPLSEQELAEVIAGHDALLSTIGSRGLGSTSVRADSARAVIAAMRSSTCRRFVVLSSSLLDEHPGWLTRMLSRTLLRHPARDQRQMESVVTASDVDWTIVRSGMLTNAKPAGQYVAVAREEPGSRGLKISRSDVAAAMLDFVERFDFVRKIVWLRSLMP